MRKEKEDLRGKLKVKILFMVEIFQLKLYQLKISMKHQDMLLFLEKYLKQILLKLKLVKLS